MLETWLLRLPFFVILMGLAALSMLVPALYGFATGEVDLAIVFVNCAGLLGFFTALIALASNSRQPRNQSRNHLLTLLAAFVFLPAVMAVPFYQALPATTFLNAYVEMSSAFTTTGATLFDDPARLPNILHLWRGQVGWMGGFFVLVTAIAVLAPLNLGGFDVIASADIQQSRAVRAADYRMGNAGRRLLRTAARCLPIYAGLTALLWLLLMVQSDAPLVNLVHAMSTLSTSGISAANDGFAGQGAGWGGELVVALPLLLALTRHPFQPPSSMSLRQRLFEDAELRLGLIVVISVPLILFFRHWVGALEVDEQDNLRAGLLAFWGSLFTTLSFLTTTGFESGAWQQARDWSGLEHPGLVLMGLALLGGGVATTAGGVKLLRAFALYAHGIREMDRLVHPTSVGGAGRSSRQLRREGAYLAWVFAMLFILSLAVTVLGFAITGEELEQAMALAVAALSTTGPVAQIALAEPVSFADLSNGAKAVLCAAMVLGRLETLVIIALFNPEFWRK